MASRSTATTSTASIGTRSRARDDSGGHASGADGVRLRRRRPGKGGTVTLFIDGKQVGEGRVDQTEAIIFSADETCDVGVEAGSPVTYDYPKTGTKFSGEVNWVEIDLGKDAEDLDHLISPEERLHWRWHFNRGCRGRRPPRLPACVDAVPTNTTEHFNTLVFSCRIRMVPNAKDGHAVSQAAVFRDCGRTPNVSKFLKSQLFGAKPDEKLVTRAAGAWLSICDCAQRGCTGWSARSAA